MDVVRTLFRQAHMWRAGKNTVLHLEVDESHTQAVLQSIAAEHGMAVSTSKDMFGLQRFARITFNS